MAAQNRPVGRNIVSHELTEDRPPSRGITQRFGGVTDISAIADATGAAERVQELLICLERRQLGKHPGVCGGAKGRVNCDVGWHFGSRGR